MIQEIGIIKANWVAIAAAITLSTIATLVATVLTFRAVARWTQRGGDGE